MITRRDFIKLGTLAGAGFFITWRGDVARVFAAPLPGGTYDPTSVPKYLDAMVVPPAMPRTSILSVNGEQIDYYEIAVRQFQQFILPTSLNKKTTVWGYGSINHPATFNYPSFTLEAKQNRPIRVRWINQLVDANGNYLPHLLPVDPTLHWANPPGPRDDHMMLDPTDPTPGPYTGPVPMVVHLHGGHTAEESDGYAEEWYLPAANNIPAGYFTEGSWYNKYKTLFASKFGVQWNPGEAVFQYENDDRATSVWYHDHTLGMTRLNVYAGPAGFYMIRGGTGDLPNGTLPGPAPQLGDAAGKKYYEIPIAIQDRAFNNDGSLFYPNSRKFFDEYEGPFLPERDVPPIWNPEFFGNMMVVNGRTWPVQKVEPRRYRFRLLNGCQSRTLVLKLVTGDPGATRPVTPTLPFWQVGSDGGFLPSPVRQDQLLLGNAYRADVVVDFTAFAGQKVYLINEGPDFPYNGPVDPADMADATTTGQVMVFDVSLPLTGTDTSKNPSIVGNLVLPAFPTLGASERTRQLTLNEDEIETGNPNIGAIPIAALLGTLSGGPQKWTDPVTETPPLGAVETWEIYNKTVDAHPMHIHEVQMQIVNHQAFDADTNQPVGPVFGPNPGEEGFKDTILSLPGEITRIKAKFDLAGRYAWHCHIVEHEDNEMMRPYDIDPYAGFPRTPVLDNFNRANGKVASLWLGDVQPDQFSIASNRAKVGIGGVMFWNSAKIFGSNQEAFFTFTQPSATATEQDLILKLTGGNPNATASQMIEILYDAVNQRVLIETKDTKQGWVNHQVITGITFAAGDTLGGRALADGRVIAFKNGTAIGEVYVTTGPKPWPALLAKGGGRIGVWFIPNIAGQQVNATFDNFGGGTM